MESRDVKLALVIQEVCIMKTAPSKILIAPLSGHLSGAVPRNQASGVEVQSTIIGLGDWANHQSFSFILKREYFIPDGNSHSLAFDLPTFCHHVWLAPQRRPAVVMVLPITHRCRQSKSPNPALCKLLGLGWLLS